MDNTKILIVEDNQSKENQTVKILQKVLSGDVYITVTKSVNGALNILSKDKFDIVFLDMQLPRFEEGNRICLFGGREILDEMERTGNNTPVILISSDKNSADCERECKNCIKFINSSEINWQDNLVNTLLIINN